MNINKIAIKYLIDVYLLRLLLSYTRQAPVSLQDSCHKIHESSISVPNIIGARSSVKKAHLIENIFHIVQNRYEKKIYSFYLV